MSRETDSPSSGPNGRGGTAYPSGTPPYGTPKASDGAADNGRSAGDRPEQPKTETTLTTRIRINIPGSRPIPPVVVRTPVGSGETSDSTSVPTQAPVDTGPSTGVGGPVDSDTGSHPMPTPAAEDKTSDWFAPRKSGAPKGGPGGGGTNGAGTPGASGAPGPGTGAGAAVGASGARPSGSGAPKGAGAGGAARPGGSRPGGTNGAGLPGAGGTGPVAPGHGGGTGSFDVSAALAAGPLGSGPGNSPYPTDGTGDGGGEPRRDGLPYFSGGGQGGPSGPTGGPVTGDGQLAPPGTVRGGAPGGPGGQGLPGGPGGPGGQGLPGGPGGPGAPCGPRVRGGMGDQNGQGAAAFHGASGGPGGPGGPGAPDGSGFPGPNGAQNGSGFPGGPGGPGGPGQGGGPGGPGASGFPGGKGAQHGSSFTGGPGGGMSDDTAILTPQKPAPEPGTPGYGGPGENVSGHTLTSGIPVVPPAPNSPFGPGAHTDGPLPHQPPKLPEPVSPAAPAASRPKKKKGRSKLVLLVTGVVTLGGIAYGAGLLMNHSDVPKGTTVLGVDIGGGTRDEAVKKLDDAFKTRAAKPLQLSVEGDTVALRPDQAGLQLDSQATVRSAAGSDYNPVSVIGSLFGNHRVVDPAMPVDEEKLTAALERAAGGSGSATEGTIKFQSGKAVAVYGKAGKGIDTGQSTEAVEEAYRAQVETGKAATVKVPTTAKEPKVTKAEVDRMMKAFAQPAMSANVTVKAGGVELQFSPENSLWKFLGVKANAQGKLVEYYDLEALKELYGGAFDGVLITRGNGKKTPVTPQDVVGAMRPALLGKTAADRVGVIETNPS
ncbi:hypothetical protein OHB35_19790 [Streptomyces phaeochromogenes]|uniref:Peptidoglycan binding domain-containing protein n=1 Tax=Streptomyces phaeochromogenes TaxID=1923 RepID=A0ABZ1HAY7_STRPH|nr:hypothetical protein [Streptomyces phaeochromogenes]WSD15309.1 hypothetical protein OHB35_19790 [Streptomyces phaeochromogenes]